MDPQPGAVLSLVVRAPASTANLGPGFDCLGLTLDLWNETEVRLDGEGVEVVVQGEGADDLPRGEENLVAATILRRLRESGVGRPSGLRLRCRNRIPLASGLGSSAAAVVTGLLAAESIAGRRPTQETLLRGAVALEGHADNAAAVVLGGLTAVSSTDDDLVWSSWPVPRLPVVVVTPEGHYSTPEARASLPTSVPLADAVANLSRVPLVIEALRQGDLDLLRRVMVDRLHEPARLALTPGASAALRSGREAGSAALAVSGSGPSLVAFVVDEDASAAVAEAMVGAFAGAGVTAEARRLHTCSGGVHVMKAREDPVETEESRDAGVGPAS